jgi:hypothetical protein
LQQIFLFAIIQLVIAYSLLIVCLIESKTVFAQHMDEFCQVSAEEPGCILPFCVRW